MFDPGFSEIILIAVIALVVLGPERLPTVARKLGRFIGNMQRMFVGFQHEVQRHVQAVEQPLKDAKNAVESEIESLESDVSEQVNEIRQDVTVGEEE